MGRNTSRHSWTCMNVLTTNCWLVCGLILQQTFNLWFFISWANITNCIKSALSLGSCSSKPCKVIGQLFKRLSRFSVHMLLCPWYLQLVWPVPLAQVLPRSQLIFPSKTWLLEFIWFFSNRNHLKINISHILNPNLTK